MRPQVAVAPGSAAPASDSMRVTREVWQSHLIRTAATAVIMLGCALMATAEEWVWNRLPLYGRAKAVVLAVVDAW